MLRRIVFIIPLNISQPHKIFNNIVKYLTLYKVAKTSLHYLCALSGSVNADRLLEIQCFYLLDLYFQ